MDKKTSVKAFDNVEVFGQKIPVFKKPTLRDGHLGLYDNRTKIIEIEESLHGKEYYHTLIHEMVHALQFRISLYQGLSPEMMEIIADTTATLMIDNFDF